MYPLTSEFDNLILDPSVKRRAQTCTDVDPPAEEGSQISLEGHKIQQRASRLKLYEQVEVAHVVGRFAGHRAKNSEMAGPMSTSEREQIGSSRAKLAQHHGHGADSTAGRRTSWPFARTCGLVSLCSMPCVSALFIAPGSRLTSFHTVAPPRWE